MPLDSRAVAEGRGIYLIAEGVDANGNPIYGLILYDVNTPDNSGITLDELPSSAWVSEHMLEIQIMTQFFTSTGAPGSTFGQIWQEFQTVCT